MDYAETLNAGMEETVRKAGFPVHINTGYCQAYQKRNGSCAGCESQPGCSRVSLGLKYYQYTIAKRAKHEITEREADRNIGLFMSEVICTRRFSTEEIDRRTEELGTEIEGGDRLC